MQRQNIHEEDIFAAAREPGLAAGRTSTPSCSKFDGAFSVIAAKDAGDDMLKDVRRNP
jgi:hypothetical protein